jgi:UDP-glucose 4-epimerase
MTILITGAGIIGSTTARFLSDLGIASVLMDKRPNGAAVESILQGAKIPLETADVCDHETLCRLVDTYGVSDIIHTAALLSSSIRNDHLAGISTNIMGTANVLETARKRKLRRVVIASSSTVFYSVFDNYSGLVPEDFSMHVLSQRTLGIYPATKLACEQLALVFRDHFEVDAICLRYAAVLGDWAGPNNSIPGRLIRAVGTAKESGGLFGIDDATLVWNGGEEFVDARDCARANLAALQATAPQTAVYNISGGQLVTFDDFLNAARAVVPNFRADIKVKAKGGFGGFPLIRQIASDVRCAQDQLGFSCRYSLAETLKHYVN